MTSMPAEGTKPSSINRPPPPLPPPDFVLSNSLTAALYTTFSKPEHTRNALASILTSDVLWSTPLFDTSSFDQLCDALQQFFSFFEEPTITIYSADHAQSPDDSSFSIEWTISFLYPLPWRPRVSLSGTSVVQTVDNTGEQVSSITDKWYVSLFGIFRQALPRLTDLLWLWPAPHAETDAGGRRVLQKTRRYTVVEQAPRTEFRVRSFLEVIERELVFATPALPEECFEGGLRRMELYSTVSPLEVRQLDEGMYEWTMAVPGAHVGSSNILLQAPLAECASVHVTKRRVFAVYRFGGFSKMEMAEQKLKPMLAALRKDGLWDGEMQGSDVRLRLYDIKVGFNSSGLLAMCMFGFFRPLPRLNEIAIDITDRWEEER